MTTTSFGELLLKYMDRANARVDKLAEAADVSRQTVISWKKDSFNPRNRGKVLACAKFLKLTEEETNLLLVAAGFAEEYVLNELAGTIFVKFIRQLFVELSQLNPFPIMTLFTQANWGEPPAREALLVQAKKIYSPENVLHIQPPYSSDVEANQYFSYIGEQCGFGDVEDEFKIETASTDFSLKRLP